MTQVIFTPRRVSAIMRVVGVTGMPGSGKSEAMDVARSLGHPVVRMGDLVWEEVERRGLPRDAAHVGEVADAMRKEHGDDVWALRTVERVRQTMQADPPLVLIDGIRSNREVQVLRRELGAGFTLLAIHSDARQRHERLTRRGRDDDPGGEDANDGHRTRDDREMGWGIARTIALADQMIVNTGSLERFRQNVASLLREMV